MDDNFEGRILVVDDEVQIQKFLNIALRAQELKCLSACRGQDALNLIDQEQIHIVILDLGLPDMDGKEVLIKIRKKSQVPVIVLSARSNEIEKIELFDAGANDYVTKPFSVNELMARIRALLRVSQQLIKPVSTYESESLRIDFQTREVLLENVSVNFTKKEFELLELLVSQEGKLLTQSQIIKRLWGPSHAENTHYLRILVAKLRNKLGDNAIDPKFIFTEPGVGLRFISKPS